MDKPARPRTVVRATPARRWIAGGDWLAALGVSVLLLEALRHGLNVGSCGFALAALCLLAALLRRVTLTRLPTAVEIDSVGRALFVQCAHGRAERVTYDSIDSTAWLLWMGYGRAVSFHVKGERGRPGGRYVLHVPASDWPVVVAALSDSGLRLRDGLS